MSDIFQEVDEEVRRDKAAEFWKKYQNLILAGAALIVLAAAGFRYWQYERERAGQAAGDQFQQALAALEAGKLDEAKAGLDKIAAEAPGGYRALAQMTEAGAKAQSDPPGAIAAFDAIAGDAAIDPLLRDAARLRAALLRVDIPGEEQKGAAALTSLSAADGPFRRLASSSSRRWRSRATTTTTPPSSSTSCSAIPKSRRTSGNWRALARPRRLQPIRGEVTPDAGSGRPNRFEAT